MQYFVVDPATGQKYGPADLATLNQWILEGRLLQTSTLEDAATGQRLLSSQVAGLNFPPPAGPSYTPPPNYGAPQQNYQGYARPDAFSADDGSQDVKMAYIFAVLSFLCCPLLFGGLGVWKALEAKRKGHPGAQTALIVVIVVAAASFGIGLMFNPFENMF